MQSSALSAIVLFLFPISKRKRKSDIKKPKRRIILIYRNIISEWLTFFISAVIVRKTGNFFIKLLLKVVIYSFIHRISNIYLSFHIHHFRRHFIHGIGYGQFVFRIMLNKTSSCSKSSKSF